MKKGFVENMKNTVRSAVMRRHDKYCTLDDCKLGLSGGGTSRPLKLRVWRQQRKDPLRQLKKKPDFHGCFSVSLVKVWGMTGHLTLWPLGKHRQNGCWLRG